MAARWSSTPRVGLLDRRAHPYTQGLFAAQPHLGGGTALLRPIPGTVPDLAALPPGCRFADRCRLVVPACQAAAPPLQAVGPGHDAACIRLDAARAEAEA
jgi:peptide/nickel transport system ATP-binding protein